MILWLASGVGLVLLAYMADSYYNETNKAATVLVIIWAIYSITTTIIFFLWLQHIKKTIRLILSGKEIKHFPVSIKEFEQIDSGFQDISKHLKEIELARWEQTAKQAGENLSLMVSNTTDALTGVANRRSLDKTLAHAVESNENRELTVIMLDIDHFKNVNDIYGHEAGDEVLKHFARVIRKAIRPNEFFARYGGEEFTILCYATLQQARLIAERVRKAVELSPAKTSKGEVKITTSMGLAQLMPGDTPKDMVKRADKALYRAKENGRNRCEVEKEVG